MKKLISFLMALLLITIPVPASAVGETAYRESDLIIYNYPSLTDGERAFLSSPYVDTKEVSLELPYDSLISVDTERCSVSAPDFGVWRPVAGRVVSDGNTGLFEIVSGAGTFVCPDNRYTVEVDYSASLEFDAKHVEKLLNGAHTVATALKYADALDSAFIYYNVISENASYFSVMTDPDFAGEYCVTDPDTVYAIENVYRDSLSIQSILFDYESAQSKISFILRRGEDMKRLASALYGEMSNIRSDPAVTAVLKNVIGKTSTQGKKIQVALGAIKTAMTVTAEASGGEWRLLDPAHYPLKDGLSTAAYIKIDALAKDAADASCHSATTGSLMTPRVTLRADVDLCSVRVKVTADVIPETSRDSFETVRLGEYTRVLRLPAGSDRDAIENAVESCGIERTALAEWDGVARGDYVRTVSGIPDTLDKDIEILVSYTPKYENVTFDYSSPMPSSYPYGYRMTLPKHGGDLVYDYYINGEHYFEGTVWTVIRPALVARSEGKPWTRVTLGSLVADAYSDVLDGAERVALSSPCSGGKMICYRTPDKSDVVISDGVVSAPDKGADVPGVRWSAASASVFNIGDPPLEFTFDGGLADIGGVFDVYNVEYEAALPVNDDDVSEYLSLVLSQREEYLDVKKNADLLFSLYEQFAKLDRASLRQIEIAVNGSEMSDRAKAASKFISDNCVDRNTSHLYIYHYLMDYKRYGASYLYESGVYDEIRTQTGYITENLRVMNADPELLPLLNDIGYGDYYYRIGEIVGVLNEIAFPDMTFKFEPCDGLSDYLNSLSLSGDIERIKDGEYRPLEIKTTVTVSPGRCSLKLDGEVAGYYMTGDAILLPVPPSRKGAGVLERFFKWTGGETAGDPFSEITYTMGERDAELVSLWVIAGDVNADGKISLYDLPSIRRLLAGAEPDSEGSLVASDINGDRRVELHDLSCLKKYLAGSYEPET